ncbi:heterokaryon incompatibility protein-domain-containing protein [Lophiotrema nucula]|uniref:Heterokaryon incompatibility protein-domain-containing protein n=1 Tax=Lophiotrema nucula TaxID=690887 RepID=A0A6A5YHK8_9PLEO|nr:heterokaryon incompatibility protein-domain-containing protein [Lophiotrema nucula]
MAQPHYHPTLIRDPEAPSSALRFKPQVIAYVRDLIKATGLSSKNGDADLCRKCRAMFSARGLFHLFTGGELYSRGKGGGFKHSRVTTFAARINCHFCRFTWNEDYNRDTSQPISFRRLCDFVNAGKCAQPRQTWIVFRATVDPKGTWGGLAVRVESGKGRLLWTPCHDRRTTVAEASCLSPHVQYRPAEWAGLTATAGSALRGLLNDCEKHHHDCQPSGPRPLPTRLLRLTEDGRKYQLHLSQNDQEGQYAALSYCWGGPQDVRLLNDNIERLVAGPIDSEQLPQTLRDAIAVTRILELEYLWVDALCIIQDDTADKQREISRMCSIYGNSTVTIVAAIASSVKEGFLHSTARINERYPSCSVSLAVSRHGEIGSQRCTITFVPTHAQHTTKFPINARGWAFQESYIPPRLLVFGDQEPFLRCRMKDATPLAHTAIDYKHSRIEPRCNIDYALPAHIREQEHISYNLREIWRYVVERYTERQFSFAGDRPLAIRGIVDFLESRFDDQCYFGIWGSIPVGCLLWTVRSQKCPASRCDGIPTWSWLSVLNEVDLDHLELLGSFRGDSMVEFGDRDNCEIAITCPVIPIEDVAEEDEIEYWQDRDKDDEVDRVNGAERFVLLLSKMSNDTVVGLCTVRQRDQRHERRGVIEIRDAERWHSKPKMKVIVV